jgi:hypothetical protein
MLCGQEAFLSSLDATGAAAARVNRLEDKTRRRRIRDHRPATPAR